MNILNSSYPNSSIVRTEDVIGRNVLDSLKEKIGTVNEIVLDKVSGEVRYAVIATGGFLGIGKDLHAVPWKTLSYDPAEEGFTLNKAKADLASAPGFDKNNWPDFADQTWEKSINDYYHL